MNAEHHYLRDAAMPAPARWVEAFPAGRVHSAEALYEAAAANWQGLLWLNSDDSRWFDHLAQARRVLPATAVILLSSAPDVGEGLKALDAGVRGYTHAYAVAKLLREVATVVEHGGLWVGPELLQRLVSSTAGMIAKRPVQVVSAAPNPWTALSAREAQVAQMVAAGRSNKEVAAAMFISERTVKAHLSAIFEKLSVRDRLQLVVRLADWPTPDAAPSGQQA